MKYLQQHNRLTQFHNCIVNLFVSFCLFLAIFCLFCRDILLQKLLAGNKKRCVANEKLCTFHQKYEFSIHFLFFGNKKHCVAKSKSCIILEFATIPLKRGVAHV